MTQRAKASARRTMLGRAAACMVLGGGIAATLAPAASAVAPGANGRLASFAYAAGSVESWVQHGDPLSGDPLVDVSRAFAGGEAGAADTSPSWSPDGRLVLSGDPDGNAFAGDDAGPDLIVTNAEGTSRTNVTRTPAIFELEPAWSPDGRTIAYSTGGPYGPGEALWTMDADGTGVRSLGAGAQPAWSPDGRRLAFTRDGDVFTMTRGGNDVRRVTSDPGTESSPTWAPDGRTIAWASEDFPEGALPRQDIWSARQDGTRARRLVHSRLGEWAPAFSPDGTSLAFSRRSEGECCPSLWVRDLDTGAERRVLGTDGADWERRNRLPVAAFTADPEEPRAGHAVTLRSTSSDADGPLVQRWDLDGDGRFDDATGDLASVMLEAARPELTVRLRVRDTDGAEATATRVLRLAAPAGQGGGGAGGPEVAPAPATPVVPGAGAPAAAGGSGGEPATPAAPAPAPAPGQDAPAGPAAPAAPVLPPAPAAVPPSGVRSSPGATLLLGASVTARGGRIAVPVSCAAACRGTLRIVSTGGRVLGTLTFRRQAGTSTLRVLLRPGVVRRARTRPVALRAVLTVAGEPTSRKAFTLRAR